MSDTDILDESFAIKQGRYVPKSAKYKASLLDSVKIGFAVRYENTVTFIKTKEFVIDSKSYNWIFYTEVDIIKISIVVPREFRERMEVWQWVELVEKNYKVSIKVYKEGEPMRRRIIFAHAEDSD
jgi:hypothetical protein